MTFGPLVQFHINWTIGTYDSISILEDSQLNGLPLNMTPTFINMEINYESRKIAHLIKENRQWDEDILAQLLPPNLTESIKLIPIPQGQWHDQLC